MILDALPGIREQPLEHPTHGEDGGPRIDGSTRDVKRAHLAALGGGTVQHHHIGPPPREVRGRGQPADARTNHDHAHGQAATPRPASRRARSCFVTLR